MGNTPSFVPVNGQVSQVRFPIDCTNTGNGSVLSQEFSFSATAHLAAGSYYLSDVRAALPYPGHILGGKLDIDIAFSNANPSVSHVSDTTLNGNTLVIPGQGLTDSTPTQHGNVTVGPIKSTGPVSRYSVSGVSYVVIDKSNKQSNYTCSVRANIVGSVANDGTSQSALPAAAVPTARSGSKATNANLPLVCKDQPYGLQITGSSPLQPSELFDITDFIFFFKVPSSEVARIQQAAGSNNVQINLVVDKQKVPGSIAGLGFNLTNASPATYDLVTDGYTPMSSNGVQISGSTSGGNLTLAFPVNGNLTLNPWQITSSGIFAARPLGVNGLLSDSANHVNDQVACNVPSGVEVFAGPVP